jgi:large subunit ribosomal protein L6
VKVEVQGRTIKVSGPKGNLSWEAPPEVTVEFDASASQLVVNRQNDESRAKAMHGLSRAVIANMVHGCDQGYEKKMEIYGTGYSCNVKGQQLLLNCGHMGRGIDRNGKQREAQFFLNIPEGLTVNVETPAARGNSEPARMSIVGADKQQVGQFAAEIRGLKPPEPYLGKGIRYADEVVQRKQGKAFAGGG